MPTKREAKWKAVYIEAVDKATVEVKEIAREIERGEAYGSVGDEEIKVAELLRHEVDDHGDVIYEIPKHLNEEEEKFLEENDLMEEYLMDVGMELVMIEHIKAIKGKTEEIAPEERIDIEELSGTYDVFINQPYGDIIRGHFKAFRDGFLLGKKDNDLRLYVLERTEGALADR